jgi:cell division protein FtsB
MDVPVGTCMASAVLLATARMPLAFNSGFYTAAVTVIPIFFIALAIQLRVLGDSALQTRLFKLLHYRSFKRFDSSFDRARWLFSAVLTVFPLLVGLTVVVSAAAESYAFMALDQRRTVLFTHGITLLAVLTLPVMTVLWVALEATAADHVPDVIDELRNLEAQTEAEEEALDDLRGKSNQIDNEIEALTSELSHDSLRFASGEPVEQEVVEARQRKLQALGERNQALDKELETASARLSDMSSTVDRWRRFMRRDRAYRRSLTPERKVKLEGGPPHDVKDG